MTEFKYDLNVELLDKVIEWAKRSRENTLAKIDSSDPMWFQGTWYEKDPECGTVCCAAGYIGEIHEVVGKIPYDGSYVPKLALMQSATNHLEIDFEHWAYATGLDLSGAEDYGVAFLSVGAFYLGITEGQAARLFNGANTLEELIIAADELKEYYS